MKTKTLTFVVKDWSDDPKSIGKEDFDEFFDELELEILSLEVKENE